MILSGQSIRERCEPYYPVDMGHGNVDYRDNPDIMITPFVEEKAVFGGRSYGLSHAGYDIRVSKFLNEAGEPYEGVARLQCGDFLLASSMERIKMPNDLLCIVHDKSSWAREGLALQNTVLEPGWEGWITLELSFHRPKHALTIKTGDPIAQLIFHKLDQSVEGYKGKYQAQPDMPVEARLEETSTHYVSFNGSAYFVKEADFFVSQNGLTHDWGKNWKPVIATSIEDAREKAKSLFPPADRLVHKY